VFSEGFGFAEFLDAFADVGVDGGFGDPAHVLDRVKDPVRRRAAMTDDDVPAYADKGAA
jgi:hypothetical protein